MCHGEAFHRQGVQDVKNLILVDALFLLDQGRRREGKKKEKEKKSPWRRKISWGWIHLSGCGVGCSC
jgi:hypothetical protein